MSLKDAYVVIKAELDATLKARQQHEGMMLDLQRRVTYLGGILVTLRDSVCQRCLGRGEHWVSYAQDDTKMEKCPQCGGSGLPKGVQ